MAIIIVIETNQKYQQLLPCNGSVSVAFGDHRLENPLTLLTDNLVELKLYGNYDFPATILWIRCL